MIGSRLVRSAAVAGLAVGAMVAAAPLPAASDAPVQAATPAFQAAPLAPVPAPFCGRDGDLKLICGAAKPEDIQQVPGTNWVVSSSLAGGIYAVNVRDKQPVKLFPAANARFRFDRKTYSTCPGQPSAEELANFTTLGINVGPGRRGLHRLYIDRYPGASSVHVFQLDMRGVPALTWVGCVPAPGTMLTDAVVGLRDGGFIGSKFYETGPQLQPSRERALAGKVTGELWEWHSATGWKTLPGTESAGTNGVEISRDEKTLYVAQWGSYSFMRVSRGATPPKRDVIKLDFRPDNVHWAPDGMLLVGGQTENGGKVVKVDPKTLKVTDIFAAPDDPTFFHITGAIQLGRDYWIASSRAQYIAVYSPDGKR